MSSGSVSHTNNALNRWKPTSSSCGRSGVRKGLANERGLNKTQTGAISRRRNTRFLTSALRDSVNLLPWTTRQVEVGAEVAGCPRRSDVCKVASLFDVLHDSSADFIKDRQGDCVFFLRAALARTKLGEEV